VIGSVRENTLRALLSDGAPTLGTRIHSTWPSVIEALGHTRMFDYVEFLAEYAPFDLYDLDSMCRAAELHGLGTLIKIDQEPRTFLAQRSVGAGFNGVLFADCRNVADAEACIAAVRPDTPTHGGTHGVGMRRVAYMTYGGDAAYVTGLERVVVALMIEKQGAVDAIDDILALPGLDLIQFGPVDYSLSAGRVGAARSDEIAEIERFVIGRCRAAGVPVRVEIGAPEDAERYRAMDVRHFSLGVDLTVLYEWWRANGRRMRELLASA
jgi:4-hydroxy-2-oxoheptanedioate aldolase